MYNVWTIARREYKAYFASPVAYIVAFLILAVVGGLFTASIFFTMQAMGQVPPPGVQVVTGTLMFLLVFACPALTMRLLSEEQRLGTMELLLTAPVRDWELVVGKWFGSFLFVLTIIALTLIYPIVLNALVDPGIDQGPLLSGYLGVVLVSGAFLAIGVAVSSLFSNQVASFSDHLWHPALFLVDLCHPGARLAGRRLGSCSATWISVLISTITWSRAWSSWATWSIS
jgi:ABC-2 type transport system permease protein